MKSLPRQEKQFINCELIKSCLVAVGTSRENKMVPDCYPFVENRLLNEDVGSINTQFKNKINNFKQISCLLTSQQIINTI